jgi:multidrug resistance efflux pump
LILCGLALAAFVPVPYQVGGEVDLEWPEGARQEVRPPMAAIVEEVYVTSASTVEVEQPLVKLRSRDLDTETAGVRERLARAQEDLQEALRTQTQAEASLIEIDAQIRATQERASRLQTRLANLDRNLISPEIQALMIQRDQLTFRLDQAKVDWERYRDLNAKGAVPTQELEIKELTFRTIEQDLKAKNEEIKLAQQRLSDSAADEQGAVNFQNARFTAANLVAKTNEQIAAHRNTVQTLEARLTELLQQEDGLVLLSTQVGTILDKDLDLLAGQAVAPDSVLLRIANLEYLTANVKVKEEDWDYVQIGMRVTFRPNSAKSSPLEGEVESISAYAQLDQTEQRRVATVRVKIHNPDGRLLPSSSGYAKIASDDMRLYQRVKWEIIKLVPSKFL